MHTLEDIEIRRSVRNYMKKEINVLDRKIIEDLIDDCKGTKTPFGHDVNISIVSMEDNQKIATYGIIKNPPMYIGGACLNTEDALVDFGYVFESLVLSLTHDQLGTCWLAGTFKREGVKSKMDLQALEIIPAITPVGYFEEKGTLENMMRKLVKADNRIAMDQIFFYKNFSQSMSKSNILHLDQAMDMVRLGPSASNKQPWRIVMSEDYTSCHFYGDFNPKYHKALGFSVQSIDMGIAMYHFEFTLKSLGEVGKWIVEDPILKTPNDNYQYISTYKFNTTI